MPRSSSPMFRSCRRRPQRCGPKLPRAIDDAIVRALAKDPNDRYPTCQEFVGWVQAALEPGLTEFGIGGARGGCRGHPAHGSARRTNPEPAGSARRRHRVPTLHGRWLVDRRSIQHSLEPYRGRRRRTCGGGGGGDKPSAGGRPPRDPLTAADRGDRWITAARARGGWSRCPGSRGGDRRLGRHRAAVPLGRPRAATADGIARADPASEGARHDEPKAQRRRGTSRHPAARRKVLRVVTCSHPATGAGTA